MAPMPCPAETPARGSWRVQDRYDHVRPRLQLLFVPLRVQHLGRVSTGVGPLFSWRELQNGKIPQGLAPDASAVGTIIEEERGRKLVR